MAALLVVCSAGVLVLSVKLFDYFDVHQRANAEAKQLAQSEVKRAADRIDQTLARIVPIVESLARRLSAGQLEDRQPRERPARILP